MPYLTNTERLALGLVGSSAPEEAVVAAAQGEPEQEQCELKPTKRARNRKGEFKGDDPATPEVNEAFEAE
jgi:hypothetical protein